MSSEVFEIPRHGAAGVAFLGAEFKDAVILLASVPLGLVLGHLFGVLFYVVVPWLGGCLKKVTGSSFAAPHLAGLLARLLSVCPDLPPLQAKALLHQLALPAPALAR